MTEVISASQFRAEKAKKRNKYGSRKVVLNGEGFDSQREAERHLVLLDRQKRGEISDLERQVTFALIVNGKTVGSVRPDWTYLERGKVIADDSKGYQTRDHKTRWKLAQALYPNIIWRLS